MRKWILAAIIGLLALTAAGSWGYSQHTANRKLENYISNLYQRAFYDLAAQTQSLEVLLSKSLVASDPRLDSALLMDIRQQAAFAQSNLGQLPLNDALAGRTAKFLSQVGDYADSLARQVNQGESIDAGHWDTLNSLYRQAAALNSELQGIQSDVAQHNFYFNEMVRQIRGKLQNPPDDLAKTDFQSLDAQMQSFPALIYDGPFSEHLERAEPRDLEGLENIDATAAEQKALAFVDSQDNTGYQARVTGTTSGRIPAYRVEVTRPGESEGAVTLLDVSRQGGKIVWMMNSRPVGDPAVSIEAARQKAGQFLAGRGFGEMRSTYYQLQGNVATLNFAAVQNGITLYPDLVKVTIALDNGEVLGAETSGYLMSHRERSLPEAAIPREHAQAAINPRLEVSGGNLVLIPVGAADEKLVYEFHGKLGEDSYLIYINAENGREEKILKLIETPGGTLTI